MDSLDYLAASQFLEMNLVLSKMFDLGEVVLFQISSDKGRKFRT